MKGLVVRNALWNWAGMGASMIAGFVVAPFLVHHLGQTTYGLWILIASLTGYFGLLDLGIRGSVGRNIAFCQAKGDAQGVRGMLNTALALLCGAALLALVGTLAMGVVFFRLVEVPVEQVTSVRWALLVVGINLSLTLLLNIFDASLWAFHRFDILNAIEIPTAMARTALTICFVRPEHGLETLALITLGSTLVSGGAKALISFRLDHALRLSLAHVRMDVLRTLFGYGIWYFISYLFRAIIPHINTLIIGAKLGASLVTPYIVAARLTAYASSIIVAGTGVLTPLVTALHANDKRQQQQHLYLQGGKYCAAVSLFFLALFLIMGPALISRWMGAELAGSSRLLAILAFGEVLPWSQWVTHGILLAKARHQVLAWASVAECLVVLVLGLVLVDSWGLMGACVALALAGTTCRGLIQLICICRVLELSFLDYLRQSVAPALATAVLPAAGLYALTSWQHPSSWLQLFLYAGLYGLAFVLSGVFFLSPPDHLRAFCAKAKQLVRAAFSMERGPAPCLEDAE